MANNITLITAMIGTILSLVYAQALLLQLASFCVIITSIAYHGFDRRQNSLIHKIDIAAVVVVIVSHIFYCPYDFLPELLTYYAIGIFFFRVSHHFPKKVWYMTSCGHAMGAFANMKLSVAMANAAI
eukprot:jgi/Bigna1/138320/aug1.44_g13028